MNVQMPHARLSQLVARVRDFLATPQYLPFSFPQFRASLFLAGLVLKVALGDAMEHVPHNSFDLLSALKSDSSLLNKQSVESWLQNNNVADALGVRQIEKLRLPVHVNLFVLGLDGTGNEGVAIPTKTLAQWLEHLDHSISLQLIEEHNEVETGTAWSKSRDAPDTTGNCWFQNLPSGDNKCEQMDSGVIFSYTHHMIALSPLVLRVIEQHLAIFHRLSSPDIESPLQIDPNEITAVLQNLIETLGLDSAYNIFAFNPKIDWLDQSEFLTETRKAYGYREGFSEYEIEEILKSEFLMDLVSQDVLDNNEFSNDPSHKTQRRATEPLASQRASRRRPATGILTQVDYTTISEAWAQVQLAKLEEEKQYGPFSIENYIRRLLTRSWPRSPLEDSVGEFVPEECLSDNFVGKDRVLWVDLSAGLDFSWGPIVGGEGLRSSFSFPSISLLSDHMKEEKREIGDTEDDSHSEEYTWSEVELEVLEYESYLETFCRENTGTLDSNCRIIKRRLAALKSFQKKHGEHFDGKYVRAAEDAGASPLHLGQKEGRGESLAMDHFSAHLASSLSSALYHVITPSLAELHLPSSYSKKVAFHLYVLSNHDSYNPLADGLVARLQNSIEQLRLPSQTFSYSVQSLSINDDPTLTVALASSFRSSTFSALKANGFFASRKRVYLDSLTLEDVLSGSDISWEQTPSDLNHASKFSQNRDISIFLFSLDQDDPVFIDHHHISRALTKHSMVVAVQSPHQMWESPRKCNGAPCYWNLRNPVHSIVSSVALVLGGVLPSHLTFSPAHNRVAHDWKWAVGVSPLNPMSQSGTVFSQIHKDVLHRSYIISSIRAATAMLNSGHRLLSNLDSSPNAFQTASSDKIIGLQRMLHNGEMQASEVSAGNLQVPYLDQSVILKSKTDAEALKGHFLNLVTKIEQIWSSVADNEYGEACQLIPSLLVLSDQYASLARTFAQEVQQSSCLDDYSGGPPFLNGDGRDTFTFKLLRYKWLLLILTVASLVLLVSRRIASTKKKPKIN